MLGAGPWGCSQGIEWGWGWLLQSQDAQEAGPASGRAGAGLSYTGGRLFTVASISGILK